MEHSRSGECPYPAKQGRANTDLNIHALADRLTEQQGLDYPALRVRAYPSIFLWQTIFSGYMTKMPITG